MIFEKKYYCWYVLFIFFFSSLIYAQGPKPPIPSASALMMFEELKRQEEISGIPEISVRKKAPAYSIETDRLIMDLNPNPANASTSCNETFIAMDPANQNLFISSCNFWLSALTTPPGNNYALGYAYTKDAGGTWINNPAVVPYYGTHNRAFDPIVAFSGSGDGAHSGYFGGASIKSPGGDARVVLTRVDNMDTTPVINSTKTAMAPFPNAYFSFWDKPWLAVDNIDGSPYKERVYMCAYSYFSRDTENNDPTLGGLFFAYSTNRGDTWSSIKRITYDVPNSAFSSYVQIAIGPNGEVYVCYENIGFIGGGIWFEKSLDGGDTWTTETLAYAITDVGNDPYLELPGKDGAPDYSDFGYFKTGTNTRPFNANEGQRALSLPAMACDNWADSPNKGNIYIAWAGDPPPNDDLSDLGDIFFISSTDGGTSWSEPIRVNNDLTTTDQYFPAVTTTPDGRVLVMFYDSRYDSPANDKIDVTVAISYDGGVTFPDQRRITDVSFSPRFSSGLTMFIGDYNGIAANNEKALGVWCDFRTADTPDVDRKQIYSDTIDIGRPTGSISINSDSDYTATNLVNLNLSASDFPIDGTGLKDMRFSNDGGIWSGWINYTESFSWLLSSAEGIRTVYVQFRDNSNNISKGTISDTILYDITKPTSQVLSPNGTTTTTLLLLEWSASDIGMESSGIDFVKIYWKKDTGSFALYGTYPSSITNVSFDTSSHGGDGVYEFYSIAYDKAGNIEDAPTVSDVSVIVSSSTGIEDWKILK